MIKKYNIILVSLLILAAFIGCTQEEEKESSRIPVIFDTDANNELDDQHALAYLIFNADFFNIIGITVN